MLDHAGFERWCETEALRESDILLLTASFGSSPEDSAARGLELLRQLRLRPVFPAVISLAEDGNELTAVRAIQLGAVDYLPKRLLTPERLSTSVRLALRRIEKRVQRKLLGVAEVTGVTPPKEPPREPPKLDTAAAGETWASMTLTPAVAPKPGGAKASAKAEATPSEADLAAVNEKRPVGESSDAAEGEKPARSSGKGAHGNSLVDSEAGAAAPRSRDDSSDVTAAAGSAAATQLIAPGQLEAILGSASAAAANSKATDNSFTGSIVTGAVPKVEGAQGANAKAARSGGKRTAGTAAPPVTAEFIPGYIIKMKIGESEKAVVYLATSISLGANVALKVSKTLRDDTASRQFLEREYTAIIAIRDPLVVQIYDYGVHAGFEYLAMEYLLRGDLKARMQAGLKEADALRYVEQIAAALRVVHNAGLLHRDLKPPNVMLRENDEIALIDFGLARALDGSTPSTRTGVLRGSPYYMSPEQAQGEQLDARSDFYSLGIMLYEMLTGRKPYTGATAMEVLQQHVNSPLPPLPHSLSRYESVLRRLVAKNRTERFSNADEVIAAIGELRAAATLDVESAVA